MEQPFIMHGQDSHQGHPHSPRGRSASPYGVWGFAGPSFQQPQLTKEQGSISALWAWMLISAGLQKPCAFSKQVQPSGEVRCVCTPQKLLCTACWGRRLLPGFPLAPDFSSLEVGHLKLFEDAGGCISLFTLPAGPSLLFQLCQLVLLMRRGGSQLAPQCTCVPHWGRAEKWGQDHHILHGLPLRRGALPLWLGVS